MNVIVTGNCAHISDDGTSVQAASLREAAELMGHLAAGEEVRTCWSTPAGLRARLIEHGIRLALVPACRLPKNLEPQQAVRALAHVPADGVWVATTQDYAIAVLSTLVRAHGILTAQVATTKRRFGATRALWPAATAEMLGALPATATRAVKAQRYLLETSIARYLRTNLEELVPLVVPPGSRGAGVGPVSAAAALAAITHPARWPNIRALWTYCGLGTRDGRAMRREPGQCLHYNPHVRVALWRLAQIGWQTKSADGCYWRALWDATRPRCEANHARSCTNPRCSGAAHIGAMAWRRVLQRYVAEVYVGWRALLARTPLENPPGQEEQECPR